MLVKIRCPRDYWISPYTVLEKVLWWKDWQNIDYATPWVERWSSRLQPICVGLKKIMQKLQAQDQIHIDRWDTWNMDGTLSRIILPMLRQLHRTNHGAPFVEDQDVPEHLSSKAAEPKENKWDTDSNHFARWDWVMQEMIWTFEQLQPGYDWEKQYQTGVMDIVWKKLDGEYSEMTNGPDHTWQQDYEATKLHQQRINRGLQLFARYYQNLWD